MNTQRVRNALFTLLVHPEHCKSDNDADLQLALWSIDPFEQGSVAEILHESICALAQGRLK